MTKILPFLMGFILFVSCRNMEQKLYSGTVVEKFKTDSRYKHAAEAHVVFYCPEIKRNIDVNVTWNCYANAKVGEQISFNLTKQQAYE